MLPLHRKYITGLECRKIFRERNYPVFSALSGILKIHGIAPEYKYYTVFLEQPLNIEFFTEPLSIAFFTE